MTRRRLLDRRSIESFDLWHGKHRAPFTVSIGRYADGKPAEAFISGAKAGSETEAITQDSAVLLSIALQYGVPLEVLGSAITRNGDGTAATIVGAVIDHMRQQP